MNDAAESSPRFAHCRRNEVPPPDQIPKSGTLFSRIRYPFRLSFRLLPSPVSRTSPAMSEDRRTAKSRRLEAVCGMEGERERGVCATQRPQLRPDNFCSGLFIHHSWRKAENEHSCAKLRVNANEPPTENKHGTTSFALICIHLK